MQYRDILDRLVYSGTITEQESEIIFREAGNPKLHTSTFASELILAVKEWVDVWNNPNVWEVLAGFPEIKRTRQGRVYLTRLIAWKTAQKVFDLEVLTPSLRKRLHKYPKLESTDDIY